MAATVAVHSYGALFKYASAVAPAAVDTTLSYVKSIGGPNITFSATEITHLTSDNAFREFMAGLGDGGEVTLELIFKKSETAIIYGHVRTTRLYQVLWPLISTETTGSRWDFSGFMTALGSETDEDAAVMMPATFKITGKPTFTAGA